MFEENTWKTILARMLSSIKNEMAKLEGSMTFDQASAAALEFAKVYTSLERVLNLAFAQTTSGNFLDMRCEERGVFRKPAVAAKGTLKITGASGAQIPKDSLFSTIYGTQFKTTTSVTIPVSGIVAVPIIAAIAGVSGNVPANSIVQMPVTIAGITKVTNEVATEGGYDTEYDESLLQRYLEKARKPTTSGNKAHYVEWSLEVPGVGGAKVFPLWNGPKTVKVVIVDSAFLPAPARLVEDVQAYIDPVQGRGEGKAPIGAHVTVESATTKQINITAKLTLAAGKTLADVRPGIETGIDGYLKTIAFKDTVIRYAQIGTVLLNAPGVVDYQNLQVNGGNGNITLIETEIPQRGTVTLT
ncbi:baseplate J/gp47 family protein [Paenibacillus tyrfis]|uniref:baseplate J/gp47 family protein n=1 Tax=Paenibacillus tyrfis TaxID=1501230 RepID=UPI000B58CE86|nr:baseplate J/gp47 family protein [Paenibacillus tyrfis]